MQRKTLFSIALLATVAVATGAWFTTSRGAVDPGDGARAARAGRSGEGAAVAVVTAQAERANMPVRKRAIGFVETPASVVVKSRLDSQLMEQHVVDGQFVKAGDLLFTLDDRDLKAQIEKDEAAIARDQAVHKRTEADLARYQQLLVKNAGTQQSVDQATADERSAAATILADKATLDADKLKLGYTRILAPIDGRAGAVQVTPGNLVGANSTGLGLVTLTQMKPLRVTFTLPERDLPVLQRALGSGRAIPVTASVPDSGKPPAQGTLNFVDSTVDMTSGTITAKASFSNDDLALWPGQYVDVEIAADTLMGTTVVPTVAVQTGQKGAYVYVAKADQTAELRQIKVALSDGDRTALSEGLDPGERVVTDGQMRLKTGVRIRERAAKDGAPADPASQGTPVAQGAKS
ncbi:efflux RND transporter periplasmic adaptor subunit [Bosea psychrotolerans]|uniref:Multidrug efflux system membrane fusion protein n=1 Tax=Bosea psychrotolerans TaxID=1871628 RepID=A0A2S4M9P6_9HYPH|nr:efflux RND transporter periplasmic adaptor subunit [Bosea psychrotolerans]POR51414.1 multidrug efflux system membrane fusion protein [Bosea psychrotolerans]